jgi:hypothetical protein
MKYTKELHDETRGLVKLATEENSVANGEGFYNFSTHRISTLLDEIERLQSENERMSKQISDWAVIMGIHGMGGVTIVPNPPPANKEF